MIIHKNEDKRLESAHLHSAYLRVRLETQIDRTWTQVVASSEILVLTEPALLSSELRQMTRWPEDWVLGLEWWDALWVVAWVPRLPQNTNSNHRFDFTRAIMSQYKLQWEYCECGCRGNTAGYGDMSVWCLNNLNGSYYLNQGHGLYGLQIGVYDSWESADAAAYEHIKNRWETMVNAMDKVLNRKLNEK